jgi:hypothetical protein
MYLEHAKDQLRSRFDSANYCGIVSSNLKLFNLKQQGFEFLSSSVFFNKVLMLAEKSGINTTNCFLFTVGFLSMVYTTELQERSTLLL